MHLNQKALLVFLIIVFTQSSLTAQYGNKYEWSKDGNSYYSLKQGDIIITSVIDNKETKVLAKDKLLISGQSIPLSIKRIIVSNDEQKILIYTNSKKVWRYETRGDYWLYDVQKSSLTQIGKTLPASSLMFAKFSPDGNKAAYVSNHNLYVEDLSSSEIKQLTFDGTRKLINGTFDWAYEEEFDCRDGFRWSPDSKKIAYWQIDASNTRDYLMPNLTDSVYSRVIPVEYPVAGEKPSPYKIGVVEISSAQIKWMNIPDDTIWGTYVPRMEWAANNDELIIQHLNRKQNQSDLMLCNVADGSSKIIYTEKDSAWIDIEGRYYANYRMGGWDWLNNGTEFLWASEKDGWLHLYRISHDGKKETLITSGNYDVVFY